MDIFRWFPKAVIFQESNLLGCDLTSSAKAFVFGSCANLLSGRWGTSVQPISCLLSMSCVSRMLGHAGHMVGTKLFRHLCQLFTKGSSLDVHPSSRDYLYARVQEICKSAPAGTDSERDPESRLPCQVSTRTFGSEVHPI